MSDNEFILVPRKPTKEMLDAGKYAIKGCDSTFERDEAEVAYGAMLAAAKSSKEWELISSAPKDGTPFLACYTMVADEEDENGDVIKRGVISRHQVVAQNLLGLGIVSIPWNGGIPQNITFTHWMPLPEPPK